MNEKGGYVYILTNERHTVLYIGVTTDLPRRIQEHGQGLDKGFTKRYNVHKLIYTAFFEDVQDAINREKQMKKWKRGWKEKVINEQNPEWKELSPL